MRHEQKYIEAFARHCEGKSRKGDPKFGPTIDNIPITLTLSPTKQEIAEYDCKRRNYLKNGNKLLEESVSQYKRSGKIKDLGKAVTMYSNANNRLRMMLIFNKEDWPGKLFVINRRIPRKLKKRVKKDLGYGK